MLVLLLSAMIALAGAGAVRAQDDAGSLPPNELGVWGGGSVASSTMIGKSSGFDFGEAAIRYGRTLWSNGQISFDWTVDGIPLALISLDRAERTPTTTGEVVYGAGLAPLGFRLSYDQLGWFRPYAAATGGFLWFTERIPASGVKFNFTYDFGVGAQLFVAPEQAIVLGYKYHHISNAGIGDDNPGFDSNIFYAGFSIFR